MKRISPTLFFDRRRYPRLFVFQILSLLANWITFIPQISFKNALTPEEAMARYGKPLPPGWTAGVMSHGQYYQWWTIGERPVLYWMSFIIGVGAAAFFLGSALWVFWQKKKAAVANPDTKQEMNP